MIRPPLVVAPLQAPWVEKEYPAPPASANSNVVDPAGDENLIMFGFEARRVIIEPSEVEKVTVDSAPRTEIPVWPPELYVKSAVRFPAAMSPMVPLIDEPVGLR